MLSFVSQDETDKIVMIKDEWSDERDVIVVNKHLSSLSSLHQQKQVSEDQY